MGEAQGPAQELEFPVNGRVRLFVLPALGDVGLDCPEGDLEGTPVPEMLSQGLEVGEDGAERLDPSHHPVVRHEIVQESAKLELPVLGRRELPGPLAVGGLRNLELNGAPTPQIYTVVPSNLESFRREIAQQAAVISALLHRPFAWHALCGPPLTKRVDAC